MLATDPSQYTADRIPAGDLPAHPPSWTKGGSQPGDADGAASFMDGLGFLLGGDGLPELPQVHGKRGCRQSSAPLALDSAAGSDPLSVEFGLSEELTNELVLTDQPCRRVVC